MAHLDELHTQSLEKENLKDPLMHTSAVPKRERPKKKKSEQAKKIQVVNNNNN